MSHHADSILNVVDATNLERNLYLTTQLIETGIPVTLALNMSDVLASQGKSIQVDKLSYWLGGACSVHFCPQESGVDEAVKRAAKEHEGMEEPSFPCV